MIGQRWRWCRTRLNQLLRRQHRETSLETELHFHFEQLVDEYRSQGLTEPEARLAAQKDFGPTEVYREEIRDIWRPYAVSDFARSIRFAVRSLRRTPWFTVTAILSLALGIGVSTAMFGLLNTVILAPLPYGDAEQLDQIFRSTPREPKGQASIRAYRALRAAAGPYEAVAAHTHGEVLLQRPGERPSLAAAARVSPNFFSVLRVKPDHGRDFRTKDGPPGSMPQCLLSDRAWRQRFGADRLLIGARVRLDDVLHEVVGILPRSFNDWRHLGGVDVFVPLPESVEALPASDPAHLGLLARRSPGVSLDEARSWLATLSDPPDADATGRADGAGWTAAPLDRVRLADGGVATLVLLLGLAGLVLTIACTNLASVCVARVLARGREFGLRAALGASRSQLVRPIVFETLLLGLAGTAGASVTVFWFVRWLRSRSTGDNGEVLPLSVDPAVVGWGLGAAIFAMIATGLAPVLVAARVDLNAALKSGGRGALGGVPTRRSVRAFLIGAQLALATTLLTGAVLFAKGLARLNTLPEGWAANSVLTGPLKLPASRYRSIEDIDAYHRRAVAELRRLPGVTDAAISAQDPYVASTEFLHQAEVVVRTTGSDSVGLTAQVSAVMQRLDPELPVVDVQLAEDRMARRNYQLAVLRDLLIGMAAIGTILAAVGVYGAIARSAARRMSEFGVRLALGANEGHILRTVLHDGLRPAMWGCAAGLAVAYAIARLLRAEFPEIAFDYPGAAGAASAVLLVVVLFACYWPARRASRADPLHSLRAE